MAKSGSKRKSNSATSASSDPPPSPSTKPEETSKNTEAFSGEFLRDRQVEGRLYLSQLTCKLLTWYFWPEHTKLSDISSIVLAFICVTRAYSKFSEADEGTSKYFLFIQVIVVASCSMNLLLGNVPDVRDSLWAHTSDLLLALLSFTLFYVLYEWLFTTCIWATRKHLLSSDEIEGIKNISLPRRWLCRTLTPPEFSLEQKQEQQ